MHNKIKLFSPLRQPQQRANRSKHGLNVTLSIDLIHQDPAIVCTVKVIMHVIQLLTETRHY